MNTSKRFSFFSIAVLLSLVLSLIHPGTVFADGDTPPTDPPAAAVTLDSGTNPSTTEAAEATDSVPPAEAVTPDSEINPSTTESVAANDSAATLTDTQDAVATEVPATGTSIMDTVQAITDSGATLIDANGQPIPLVSQQAAEILSQPMPDPIGCPPGVAPNTGSWGGTGAGCTRSYPSIQAAVNDSLVVNGWTIYIETGSYAEDVTINKNVTLTGQVGGATAQKFILNSDIGNLSNNVFAPVIYVNPGGSIQDGILLVSSDGTGIVNVASGTYMEAIEIKKPLTLRSISGAASTIINGGDPYSVFISSANVTLDGFTITNPGYTGLSDASGIVVEPDPYGPDANIRITNNIIHDIGTPDRTEVAYGKVV
jgi:hypothetical protein